MGTFETQQSPTVKLLPLSIEQSPIDNSNNKCNSTCGASVQNATANIIKSGIGTGVLFMPYVFSQCGILLSIVLMAIMGVLAFYSWSKLCLVIRVLERMGTSRTPLTLESAAGLILGERFKSICVSMTLVFIYGTSVGYTIFILNTMEPYFHSPFITLAIIMVIYMPLSMSREIEKLGFFSQIGLVTLCLSIFTIIVFSTWQIMSPQSANNSSVEEAASQATGTQEPLVWVNWVTIPLNFGVFAFAYDINGVVTEVHATMASKRSFDLVLLRFIVFSLGLGSVLGIVGYVAFNNNVSPVVFLNFDSQNFVTKVISALFSFSLIASILLYGFPIVKTADRFFKQASTGNSSSSANDEDSNGYSFQSMLIVRLLFFGSISFLAVYVKSVMNVFNLLGSVFSVVLTFVFPILLLERMKSVQNKQAFLFLDRSGEYLLNSTEQTTSYSQKQSQQHYHQLNDIEQEKLPEGQQSYLVSIAILTIGIIGGISGLVSSINDLVQ